MIFVDCYRKNVFIDNQLVGYIDGEGIIYISKKEFARLSEDGDILINDEVVGNIDDLGEIYLRNRLVGIVTENNDLKFYGKELAKGC